VLHGCADAALLLAAHPHCQPSDSQV